jgi:hypothetical protein
MTILLISTKWLKTGSFPILEGGLVKKFSTCPPEKPFRAGA